MADEDRGGGQDAVASDRRHRSPRPPRRVTLAEVAKRAGVSPTAASFVLSGRDDQRIAEETKRRVRAVAQELEYRPNQAAKVLLTGRSGTIGLVSDYLSSTPYAGGAIRGALEAAREHEVLIYIAETLGREDLERSLLEGMLDRRVDGFVYAAMFTHTVALPEILRQANVVLLNCTDPKAGVPTVLPDERQAGVSAARALIRAGHREGIVFVGALPPGVPGTAQWDGLDAWALPQRLRGLTAEFARVGAAFSIGPAVTDWTPEEGRRAVTEILAAGACPRALVCVNDRVAMGAYQALDRAGLSIPNDVSVVSFDGSELARWLDPPLTSVGLPHNELGRRAVELLLAGARRGLAPTRVRMPLIPGGSVASPPTARR